jgi:RHS repeat-associated protein
MLVASIEQDTPAPKIYYTHLDHLGSTNVVTDEIGYTNQLLSYHPFGSPRVEEKYGGMIQKNQFIGQEYDGESEMSYLNARYLNNKRGQFLNQDLVFLEMGLNTSEGHVVLRNPQAMNSYSYAGNNPVVLKDPTGRFWWPEFYTDWDGYDVSSISKDNGLILKAGEVMGGRSAALSAVANNAGNIEAASRQTGMSPEMIKAIIMKNNHINFHLSVGKDLSKTLLRVMSLEVLE